MTRKLLFVHSGNESFVKLDRELLQQSFAVHDFYAPRKFPAGAFKLWRATQAAELVFCWFASWNSFWALLFARLLKKKSLLVIGGYDLANLPEANYGSQRGGFEKWISRRAMRLATTLFTNSYYSQKEAGQNADVPAGRIQVIYHGIPDPFGSLPPQNKERIALTVGNVNYSNLKRKGLQNFVETAAYLPDVQFIVIGAWTDNAIYHLRKLASPNVVFTGRVNADELLNYYQRASVYVQASLHEGFGMSVAEAMLAGCLPVVSRAGSLPEVVGDCGLYCEINSPESIAQQIQTAMEAPLSARVRARERILNHFPMENRAKSLSHII